MGRDNFVSAVAPVDVLADVLGGPRSNAPVQMPVGKINTTGGTQMRAGTDDATVFEYGQAMVAMGGWGTFPPAIAYHDGKDYWLADGFHRVAAFLESFPDPKRTVPVEVRAGTRRDAVLHAAGANANHGLRRTNQDKRRAVETLLRDEEWRQWSLREIARTCAVSEGFVHKISQELSVHGEQIKPVERTVTRGGTTYTQNTANIGSKPAPVLNTAHPMAAPAPVVVREHVRQTRVVTLPTPLSRVAIINADSRQLAGMGLEPVHLVVTSPPYNVGIEYDQYNDSSADYIPLLLDVWRACYDVMVDGARIAVVVPFGVGRNPYTPFDCQIMQTLVDAGFTLRGRIVWDKNTTGNRTSWGSYRLPSSPAIRDTTECIIIAHKGSDTLDIPAEHKGMDDKGTHTCWLQDGDYFMELAQDHWVVAPESAQRIGHPAPFPVELVKRLMHLYGFPGAHVLDPFGGSGTVGVAAKELGCNATLIDVSSNYCQIAEERIHGEPKRLHSTGHCGPQTRG